MLSSNIAQKILRSAGRLNEKSTTPSDIVLFRCQTVPSYLLPALFFGLAVAPFEVDWPADLVVLDEPEFVVVDFETDELLLLL